MFYFSRRQSFQTCYGVHSASYPTGAGGVFTGVNQPKCEADIRLHLLPRLTSGGTTPLPYMPSWGEQEQIFLLI